MGASARKSFCAGSTLRAQNDLRQAVKGMRVFAPPRGFRAGHTSNRRTIDL
jgi:hypothetical protein